ncbi:MULTISPECIES: CBS domain-containing protein [unclassified Halobacterium]|uniref:CBS domain-containing protein n=1 Tax=unclassified Halobacterium TaxID=2668073 RepID=UPI001E5050FF|nr:MULTISPECIES: CBS domain-containing protein [unclassified Halobacterium]MCD2199449.1 CBS domain-containing protein [Halobacterium sp. KA-4]MCD2204461.1 CBS domain-containing protein [Halobacterium sp. KA-6]
MPIRDIAATEVVTAARTDSVTDVAETMADEHVGSVVVEEESLPIGIVTDRQIATELGDDPELGYEHVDEIMTRDVMTIDADAGVYQAAQALADEGVRRAPLVDDDEELVGLVSLDDILYTLEEEFDAVGDILEAQSPRA